MDDTATQPQYPSQYPQPPRRTRKWLRRLGLLASLIVALIIGIVIGSATKSATTTTKIITKTVVSASPSPVISTVTVTPPPPPTGSVIATFHGSGNENTGPFNVPSNGNYLVSWSYSGNVDSSFGSSQPSNFAISATGSGLSTSLPNDIASSGHGSTEITGDDSATDSFNVQAIGSWTITVKSAP